MRSKEEAHDYRYFPEPDLVPFMVEKEDIKNVRTTLPESPSKKQDRFIKNYKLSTYDVDVLVQDRKISDFFEECVKEYNQPKKSATG